MELYGHRQSHRPLYAAEAGGKLRALSVENLPGSYEARTELLAELQREVEEYFSGLRREFHIPLEPAGTEFQRQVWRALLRIPYGETRSYGKIAAELGRPHAARAVGMANHANPILLLIPCHRVIGVNGSLTGYGAGIERKAMLLELERAGALAQKSHIG